MALLSGHPCTFLSACIIHLVGYFKRNVLVCGLRHIFCILKFCSIGLVFKKKSLVSAYLCVGARSEKGNRAASTLLDGLCRLRKYR